MKNPVIKRIAAAFLAVAMLVFVGYQIFRSNYSGIQTERAVYGTVRDSVEVSAVMIRDETYIVSDASGVINYAINSGTHVANGGTVASVYVSAEDAQKAIEMERYEEQISELQKLNGFSSGSGLSPEACDENIEENYLGLRSLIERKSISEIEETAENLLFSLNQKDIVSGKVENYDDKLAKLQGELETLRTSFDGAIDTVKTNCAGYFVGSTDGYEEAYSYEDVLTLTVEDLQVKPQMQEVPANVVGKICSSYNWYIAFTVDKNSAVEFKSIMESYYNEVDVSLPFASLSEIPAKIVAINQENLDSDAVIVLECSYMDETVSNLRFEEIQVELYSYSGIMVSQTNIHFADVEEVITDDDGNETVVIHDNVQGVYVVDGSTMKFVQIFPKATMNGYVVCKTTLSDSDVLVTGRTIDLYDSVIIDGKDLYDGKLIE